MFKNYKAVESSKRFVHLVQVDDEKVDEQSSQLHK